MAAQMAKPLFHRVIGESGAPFGEGLLGYQPLLIRLLIRKAERIGWHQVAVPLLEGAVVEHLPDAVEGRNVEMVLALRANIEQLLGFLAIDRSLAAGTANPQPFGNTPLGALRGGRRSSGHTAL